MPGDLDVALDRGGLDVDSDVGEELRNVIGELFVGDEEASPSFGDFDFDVGEGELGDLLGVANGFFDPLSVKVIVDIPAFLDLEDAGHLD